MPSSFDPSSHLKPDRSEVAQFQVILSRINQRMKQDRVVQSTTDELRDLLCVDRVVLYYFFAEWEGRVTFESLSDQKFSIFGSTGPDDCFNGEYAAMYLAGRVRAIDDIEREAIAPCHRDFLREIQVRANLVVPILTPKGLWGLLVAHHCQESKNWTPVDVERMEQGALVLANASSINAG